MILFCPQKADKTQLENKVDRDLFDTTVDDLKSIIDDVLGQLAESVRVPSKSALALSRSVIPVSCCTFSLASNIALCVCLWDF